MLQLAIYLISCKIAFFFLKKTQLGFLVGLDLSLRRLKREVSLGGVLNQK
jgi:hypothetical protein